MADGRAAPAAGSRPTSQTPGDAAEWFAGRLPDWFDGDPTVVVDREEITVIGRLPEPEGEAERSPRIGPGVPVP